MALRHSSPITFRPQGLSDAVDGTNAFDGALQQLVNLIPALDTANCWVPRPGAVQKTAFSGFASPGFVSALIVVGNIAYGLIATTRNAGKDEPFAYNISTNTFLTVGGILNANTPTSPATSGDWVPPIMTLVGTRVVVCHPGFAGGAVKFGWFDISSFSSTGQTGTTHTSTLIDALSTNVLAIGWQPGQTITGAGIPAGTTIKSIAAGGLSLTLSQATTAGTSGVALTVAGGTAAAPLWGAGDTNLNNLPSTPVAVAQFNGRAYYACGNGVVFSDALVATNVTNASQAITFGNGLPVTALGQLALGSPLTGGVVQSLIAFQGITAMQQITGDQATSNLATNILNVATGTLAPLSIVPTTAGLGFMSPDGLRILNLQAQVSDPIGKQGEGVTVPFIYASTPSRIVGAANADVMRFSVQNGIAVNTPQQDYWYDVSRRYWSGPHTFPASLIQPYQDTFLVAPVGVAGKLFQSDSNPNLTTSYTENGTALSFSYQTTLMPDNSAMAMNSMVETTIATALPSGAFLTVTAADETGTPLQVATLNASGSQTIWGSFTWGGAPWSGGANALRQLRVPWAAPVVFKQASLSISGASLAGVKLGNNYFKVEQLGYLLQ